MLDAVISVLLPEAARREGQGDYQSILTLWASAVRKLAFFFVPAYALAFILRREIIVLLFTRSYEAAVPIFAVNLLAILLFISVPTSIIRAFDELKFFRLKLSCVMVPVMFGSLYFGIRFGGLLGAISAYMLVQNLDLAIIMARILKRLKATARDLRRLAPVVRIAAATAVSAGATALVHQVVNNLHPALVIIINGSVFAAIHLTISFLLGSITEDEKDQLKRLIARFQKPGSLLARPAPNEAR
jgi:O-antigen/teichoic acid export membrane protein